MELEFVCYQSQNGNYIAECNVVDSINWFNANGAWIRVASSDELTYAKTWGVTPEIKTFTLPKRDVSQDSPFISDLRGCTYTWEEVFTKGLQRSSFEGKISRKVTEEGCYGDRDELWIFDDFGPTGSMWNSSIQWQLGGRLRVHISNTGELSLGCGTHATGSIDHPTDPYQDNFPRSKFKMYVGDESATMEIVRDDMYGNMLQIGETRFAMDSKPARALLEVLKRAMLQKALGNESFQIEMVAIAEAMPQMQAIDSPGGLVDMG